MKHSLITACLALALIFALPCAAYAEADSASLELDRAGSVALTLEDADGAAVTDGAVTIYQAAAIYLDDGNMAYAYTEAFAGCTETLDVEDSSLAAALAAYAEENAVAGTTAGIGADGTVSFDGLELGLYLVVQTTQSTGYSVISPFLVTVPYAENDTWVYDVDASPKVEVYTEPETPETPDSPTPTPVPSTPTTPELPQTGQLNWPVPVLAISGLALFGIGWAIVVTDRRKREHEA